MPYTLKLEKVKDRDRFTILPASTPHKSDRGNVKPKVVLLHATVSSTAASPLAWFQNPVSGVSSDFVIGKDGKIWRPVPKGMYSWHAGKCLFNGAVRKDYNRISYGVEIVNMNDGVDPYPEEQIRAVCFVIAMLKVESPTVAYIRRHEDVGYPKGRKSDPKGLSVTKMHLALREYQPDCWME